MKLVSLFLRRCFVIAFVASAALAPRSALAACSTPTGSAGDIIYNGTYNVLQYCNSTNWINAGSLGSNGGTLISGDFCNNNGTLISCTTPYTGTGNIVLSASPTFTGSIVAASSSWSGTVSGVSSTWTGQVAIGTTTTSGALNVSGTVTATTLSGAHTGSGSGLTGIGTASFGGITGTPSSTTFLAGNGAWTSLASAGGVTGTGTTNYIPLWTSATALGTSNIYQSGNNVGIGTTSASTALQVSGTATATTFSGSGASLTGIGTTNMSAITGTASSTTFLTGNGTWSAPAASLPSLISTDVWVGNGSNVATATATTGTGSVVMSASPTFTGTVTGGTFSGTHSGNGSGLTGIGTASLAAVTGTGNNVVLAASPTFTGTVAGATSTWSSAVAIGTTTTSGALNVSGTATATTFSGSGASLTGIGTSNMSAITGSPSSSTFLAGNGVWTALTTAALPALTSTDIWVGNGSNVATGVAMSGDCTISNAGAITCTKTSGVSFGSLATASSVNLSSQASGTLQAAQFPALTGDVTTSATSLATTVAKIQGTTVSGVTGTGNVVMSASPTLTGTITAATANFSGPVSYLFATDYSTATATQSDVAINTASAVRYTGAGSSTFYGIAAGTAGQILYLTNAATSSNTLTLSNQSASDSTAASRIITGSGADMVMANNSSVVLEYDGTASRWRVIGGSGGALSGGVTNEVPLWTSSTAIGTSNIYQSGSNIGIGTTAPQASLDDNGGLLVRGVQYSSSGSDVEIENVGSGIGTISMIANGATRAFGEMRMYGSPITFYPNGSVAMTILSGGNVGIGTTSPTAPLQVVTSSATNAVLVSSSVSSGVGIYSQEQGTASIGIYGSGSSYGVQGQGSTSSSYGVYGLSPGSYGVYGSSTTGAGGYFTSTSGGYALITGTGNVGIGTTSPTTKFHVYNGSSQFVDSTGANGGQTLYVANTTTTGTNYGIVSDALGSGASNNTALYANASGATNNYGVRIVGPSAASTSWGIYQDGGAQNYFAGNVGIGTTSPSTNLQVGSGTGNNVQIIGASGNAGLVAAYNGDSRAWLSSNAYVDFGSTYAHVSGDAGLKLGYAADGYSYIVGGSSLLLNPTGGNVGIGTTSPGALLDVHTASDSTVAMQLGSAATANRLQITPDAGSGVGVKLLFNTGNGATLDTSGPGYSTYLRLNPSGGNVGIGTTSPNGKLTIGNNVYTAPLGGSYGQYQILLYDGGAAGSSYGMGVEPFNIGFNSAGGYKFYQSGGSTPLMVIGGQSSSNVGIGTTSPPSKLSVSGGNISLGVFNTQGASTAKYIGVAGGSDTWTGGTGSTNVGFFTESDNASGHLEFATHHSGVSSGTRMTIDKDGNVGIGNTSPSTALQVTGTVTATQFVGGGAGLTGVTATPSFSGLTSGDFCTASGTTAIVCSTASTGTGSVVLSASPTLTGTITGGTFSGSGASLTSLNASNIASGTLAVANGGTGVTTSTGTGSVVLSASPTLTGTATAAAANFSGSVGIGNSSPTNPLTVLSGSANTAGDSLTSATAQVTGPNWAMNGSSSNGTFLVSTNDAVAIDVGGSIGFAGRYSTTQQFTAAAIKGAKEDNTAGNYGGYLAFGTRANGTQISEKMRITGAGNVGIGNTSPAAKLNVTTSATSPGSGIGSFGLVTTGAYGGGIGLQDGAGNVGIWDDTSGANLRFGFGSSLGGLTTEMTLTSGGTVTAAQFVGGGAGLTGITPTFSGLTSSDFCTASSTTALGCSTASTGSGSVVLSASPTLTGTVTGASSNWSGSVGIGLPSPHGPLDVSTNLNGTIGAGNGVSDGIVFYQSADNSSTIQSYIDAQWSARTTYAGPCCNLLNIETDVGSVVIGNSTANNGITLVGPVTASGTITGGTFSGTHSGNGASLTSLNAGNISSGTLAVANGGTGVTSSTGTGSVVLSASPTFTGTVSGAAATLSSTLNQYGGFSYLGSVNTTALPTGNSPSGTPGLAVSWNQSGGSGETDLWNTYYGAGSGATAFVFKQMLTSSTAGTVMTISGAGTVTATTFSGSGASLTSLNAGNISSGTLAVANGGTGVTSSTGTGSVVLSASPTLSGTITGGTFSGTHTGTWSGSTIAVANGGTGVTSSTGTGSVVLSASPTLTGTVTGAASTWSGNVIVGTTVDNVYDQVSAARPLVVQSSSSSTTIGASTNAIAIINSDTTTSNTSTLAFGAITGASTNQYTDAEIVAIHGARTNTQYPTGQLAFLTSTSTNTAPSEKMRINNSGNVGIGTASPSAKLVVWGDTYSNNFYHNSDRRLKDNIQPIVGLEIVDKLQGVTFNWKKDGKLSAGVIAQDTEAVIPEAVVTDNNGMKLVSYDTLLAPIIEAVKELHKLFDADHDEIAKLQADNDNLRAANDNEAVQIKTLTARLDALEAVRR